MQLGETEETESEMARILLVEVEVDDLEEW